MSLPSPWSKVPKRYKQVAVTCICALVASLAAVAFQLAVQFIYTKGLRHLSHLSEVKFAAASLAVILCTSVISGILMSICPEVAGSGIPQLKLAFWKDFGFLPWRVVWVKFIAGVVSIGGGTSLGREGPSVHLAGALGSNISGLFGTPKQNRRSAAALGAAAGLAAAFNTPIAAVTFVLEEIIQDLNSRILGSVLLASVVGAFVTYAILGPQPAFSLQILGSPSWKTYLLVPFVAALAAGIGMVFQLGSLKLRKYNKSSSFFPSWAKPCLGALITWVLGMLVFHFSGCLGVFSLGYDDLSDALAGRILLPAAAALLVAKLLATIACYGFGGCGGIFSPTLFFGAMAGLCLGKGVALIVPLGEVDITTLSIIGMSCCLGAAVRAPITGILIVFEMTHEFAVVPGLMIGALVSQVLARRFSKHNFYEAILEQDGHHLERLVPPRDIAAWQQLKLSTITNFNPVSVSDTDPATLSSLFSNNPYRIFPLLKEGKPVGTIQREHCLHTMAIGLPARVAPPVFASSEQSIHHVKKALVESDHGFVLVTNAEAGHMIGIVTLHDLLRAELALANHAG